MSGKPWSQGPPLFRFSFLNKVLAVLTWYLVFVPEIAWRKEGPSVNSDRHSVHPCQSSGCRSQRTIFSLGANTAPEMMNMGWGSLVSRKQAPWDPGKSFIILQPWPADEAERQGHHGHTQLQGARTWLTGRGNARKTHSTPSALHSGFPRRGASRG